MIVHEPGKCFDSLYGRDCDGIGHWDINPYVREIHDEEVWEWICDGRFEGLCMDI